MEREGDKVHAHLNSYADKLLPAMIYSIVHFLKYSSSIFLPSGEIFAWHCSMTSPEAIKRAAIKVPELSALLPYDFIQRNTECFFSGGVWLCTLPYRLCARVHEPLFGENGILGHTWNFKFCVKTGFKWVFQLHIFITYTLNWQFNCWDTHWLLKQAPLDSTSHMTTASRSLNESKIEHAHVILVHVFNYATFNKQMQKKQ